MAAVFDERSENGKNENLESVTLDGAAAPARPGDRVRVTYSYGMIMDMNQSQSIAG